MELFVNQSWDELTRPARWDKALRPAMAELESRLPGMLGAADIWLYRNVSRSDLSRIEKPEVQPPVENIWPWPLMYLVCHYRKVLFGFQLVRPGDCDLWDLSPWAHNSGRKDWAVKYFSIDGLPYIRYAIDPENLAVDLERVMKDVCEETRKARRGQKPQWQCIAGPVRFNREGSCLIERGLVREEEGNWIPTECGEDSGLITLFTRRKDGTTERTLRWSPSTQKTLTANQESGPIPLQTRKKQVERGFACRDTNAVKAVQQLAEMPLDKYFKSCPEVSGYDIQKLRVSLGLKKGCMFRTAAATLYRRMEQAAGKKEQEQLTLLTTMLTMPIIRLNEKEKQSVIKKFREEQFLI